MAHLKNKEITLYLGIGLYTLSEQVRVCVCTKCFTGGDPCPSFCENQQRRSTDPSGRGSDGSAVPWTALWGGGHRAGTPSPWCPSDSLPSLILPQGTDRKGTVQSAGKALFRKILMILIVKARQCNAGRVADNLPILIWS